MQCHKYHQTHSWQFLIKLKKESQIPMKWICSNNEKRLQNFYGKTWNKDGEEFAKGIPNIHLLLEHPIVQARFKIRLDTKTIPNRIWAQIIRWYWFTVWRFLCPIEKCSIKKLAIEFQHSYSCYSVFSHSFVEKLLSIALIFVNDVRTTTVLHFLRDTTLRSQFEK